MKLNKKTFIIISVILIITVLFFLYKQNLTRHSGLSRINTSLTPIPTITTSIPTPNQFTWKIDHLKLPEDIEIISTKSNTQGETILKNLADALNLTNGPQTIPNSPIIFYNNLSKSTDIYLNTNENLIKFSLNLLEKPIPQINTQKESIKIVEQFLDLPPSISIIKNSTHYQFLNGPRFVNSTKEKATLINSTYNYSLKSLPIFFAKGNSIEMTHSVSGKLVKLTLNLPPIISSHSGLPKTLPVKTIDQIKNTPQSQFTTITLSGDQKFQLSNQEINIDTAYLNNGFLGYIYDQETLIPYIFLTGTTQDPQYGQIEILLATPATE